MKKLLLFFFPFILVTLIVSCNQQKSDSTENEVVKDGVFIHISQGSDDLTGFLWL